MNQNQPASPSTTPEQDKSKAAPAVQPPMQSPATTVPTGTPTTKS